MNHLFVLTLFLPTMIVEKKKALTMDYAIFARTSIMLSFCDNLSPKILSSRRRKMVTYHNGPQPQRHDYDGSKGFTDRQSSALASKGKKKVNWFVRFLPGELFPSAPFRCVIRNLLFFVCVFTEGGRVRSDASATSMCVYI